MRTVLLFLLLVPFAIGCAGSAPPAGADGPVIRVTATYPGANAQTVQDTVVAPMLEQINGVEGMVRLESEARDDGSCVITVRFKPKTKEDMAQVLVQNRVALALPTVPAICQNEGITVRKGPLDRFPPLWVAVTSTDAKSDTFFLGNPVKLDVRDQLGRIPGVMDVRTIAASDVALQVWLDPNKLAVHKLGPTDVIDALKQQNLKVAAGQVGKPAAPEKLEFQLTIDSMGRLVDADDLGNVVLKTGPGSAIIRLKDVARVELGARREGFAIVNGKPAVLLALAASDDRTSEAVRKAIASMDKLPKGVKVELAADLNGPGFTLVEVRLPDAASRERTQEAATRVAKILRDMSGAKDSIVFSDREPNLATLLVRLPATDGPKLADIRKALAAEVRGAACRVTDVSAGARPFPVQFALTDTRDKSAAKLREWSEAVADRIRAEGTALDSGVEPGRAVPHLSITVDRTKLKALGVAASDVNNTLRIYLNDLYINDFNELGKNLLLNVPLGAKPITPEDLGKFQVRNDQGQMVPLKTIIEYKEVVAPSALYQVDRHNATRITAVPGAGKSVADTVARCIEIAEAERKRLKLHDDFKVVDLTAANPR